MSAEDRIAIVGAGSIGVAWAIVFAQAEMDVVLHDPDAARLQAAGAEIHVRLRNLQEGGVRITKGAGHQCGIDALDARRR